MMRTISIGVALVVGIMLGGASMYWYQQQAGQHNCGGVYSYINVDIACGDPPAVNKTEYLQTQQAIAAYIDQQKSAGTITDAAVFFRDLKAGPFFGVNEIEDFTPASLLKLPLAFAYFNVADEYPQYLNRQLFYTGTSTKDIQTFPPPISVEPNKPYTLEELLHIMLTYSDNASYTMLNDYLQGDPQRKVLLAQTFQELGIIDPINQAEPTVSVRSYASLFRLLYNASYLNADHSEEILHWLADSTFTDGLVGGVPGGMPIAHKFGERVLPGGDKQLHDCGIIYYPHNPYLLCVMTKGGDWKSLESFIKTVSTMVYKDVNARRLP